MGKVLFKEHSREEIWQVLKCTLGKYSEVLLVPSSYLSRVSYFRVELSISLDQRTPMKVSEGDI